MILILITLLASEIRVESNSLTSVLRAPHPHPCHEKLNSDIVKEARFGSKGPEVGAP